MMRRTVSGVDTAIRARYSDSGHRGKLTIPSSWWSGGGGCLKEPTSDKERNQSALSRWEKKYCRFTGLLGMLSRSVLASDLVGLVLASNMSSASMVAMYRASNRSKTTSRMLWNLCHNSLNSGSNGRGEDRASRWALDARSYLLPLPASSSQTRAISSVSGIPKPFRMASVSALCVPRPAFFWISADLTSSDTDSSASRRAL